MKEKLDAILHTLEEAQRQIAEARLRNSPSSQSIRTLSDAEVELDEIREKLERLRDLST